MAESGCSGPSAFSRLSLSELIGITFSELFGISRIGRRSFTQETEAISYAHVPNIKANTFSLA